MGGEGERGRWEAEVGEEDGCEKKIEVEEKDIKRKEIKVVKNSSYSYN